MYTLLFKGLESTCFINSNNLKLIRNVQSVNDYYSWKWQLLNGIYNIGVKGLFERPIGTLLQLCLSGLRLLCCLKKQPDWLYLGYLSIGSISTCGFDYGLKMARKQQKLVSLVLFSIKTIPCKKLARTSKGVHHVLHRTVATSANQH